MRSFTVTRSDGELREQVWVFVVTDALSIVLDRYEDRSRPTKRHKVRTQRRYDRILCRNGTMSAEEVPWPDDVVAEILATVKSELTVSK